jgi:LytS/YehU family sensor histidine kinase
MIPRFLLKGKYIKLVIGIIILIFITALFSSLISDWFIRAYRISNGVVAPHRNLFLGLLAGLRGSNTVAGFAAAIKLVKFWYFKKTENELLEKAKLKAELEILKGQIHPHFLFNTLNNLYSLTLQHSKKAPEVVLQLSELLRYVLSECQLNTITLSKELLIVKHYISLEQIRFGNGLDLSFHIEGNPEKKEIAPLMLLPLVENAFKHGANQFLEQPWICINTTIEEDKIRFKIINGKPAGNKQVNGHGIGLQNLRKRLMLLYPQKHELRISDAQESYTANLIIQLS